MASRSTSANRNQTFGRLLSGAINSIATYEGKTAPVVEEELGTLMYVAGKSVQHYKAGHLPPEEAQIKLLAEAAVRRGFLGREWLQRFLHVARYPFAEKLLDQLCPIGPTRPRPPRVYENLPAPTYSQFVMREQAFADVLDGLQQRSAAVLIVGMGGNGKTSLAREVAYACLKDDSTAPRFDAVVWVSDKDRPGTTNLSTVLDEVARTLDYPGFTQFEYEEKRREVEQLLRRQRVLLVVDNFETVTDGALLTWLLRLPEPSKALITSREYSRAFRNSTIVLDLRGMSDTEAQTLVNQRLRVLRMEQLVSSQAQLEPLVAVTGGNPKAIEIALGLMKYERRPLQQVVDDLYAARGKLFDDLFAHAWSLLDEAARRVLLVMTFFPISASAEALAATADVQGYRFVQAVERLTDLALLDVQQQDLISAARYALHPLVRVFTESCLREHRGFEIEARDHWISWYMALGVQVGYCPNDLDKLTLLDAEHQAIFHAMEWVFHVNRHAEVLRFGNGIMYFFFVRGLWDRWFEANKMRLKSARALKDFDGECRALAYQVQMLSRQGRVKEAAGFLSELNICINNKSLDGENSFIVHYCIGAYNLAIDNLQAAKSALETLLIMPGQLSHYRSVTARQWLGLCLYYQGQREEANLLFQEVLKEAIDRKYGRYILFSRIRLAAIETDNGHLERAVDELFQSYDLACGFNDREQLADTHRLFARLHILRNDLPAARASLAEAVDLFERLGMRRELAEARQALADLEASAAPVA